MSDCQQTPDRRRQAKTRGLDRVIPKALRGVQNSAGLGDRAFERRDVQPKMAERMDKILPGPHRAG